MALSKTGILRQYVPAIRWVQQALDLLAALSLLYLLTVRKLAEEFPIDYEVLALVSALLMLVVYQGNRVYHHFRADGLWWELQRVLRAWAVVLILLALLGFITKTNERFSREVLLTWSVLAGLAQAGLHIVLRLALQGLRLRGVNQRRALLVGSGRPLREFAERLNRNAWLGIAVVGWVTTDPADAAQGDGSGIPLLGQAEELPAIVRQHHADLVYVTLPFRETGRIETLMERLLPARVDVHWVPDISALQLLNHSVHEIDGQPVLCLSDSPITGARRVGKWIEDKALAALILLLASPLLLLIALAIKLTSRGPVLFQQRRGGLNARPITIYKFRTMRVHREAEGRVSQARRDDPRLTPIGSFLRRTSLDELPQFINVLQGRMSIVGPRPHALEHDGYYEHQIAAYMLRHRIRPGITGWAQVNGWRGETDTLGKMRMRVEHDLYYINNWSLSFDFLIIALTVWSLFHHKTAY
ncbi:MAG: undecaprenyl-phosphate glucose phosphotransferase [Candidatus Lambdaproteobacteria bacterium]|nr:undecaprenyl-phosphate glucose phosphotransferase [Candidatus Lambdaproteobacteria bacterium]